MLKELCEKRQLPVVWDEKKCEWNERRGKILELLLNEEYGVMPKNHDKLSWEVVSTDEKFCAGNATLNKVILTACFGDKKHSFPIHTAIPKGDGKFPYIISINFRGDIPDKYMPVEEICDRGYALVSFDYQDVTLDDHKIPEGVKAVDNLKDILFEGVEKEGKHCGKIAMWSWAASLAMDYAQTLDNLDHKNSAVAGHSRLGKTALLTGARDERFQFAFSNDSGCSGAAVSRGKNGESIERIIARFGYWFCDNYRKYVDSEDKLPFDQHFLLAAIAPRNVYVASGSEDLWADPESEFLSCYAAGEVYEKMGLKGFVCNDKMPEIGEKFHEGSIGYHLRKGPHYFSRYDWNLFLDYMEKHKK